MIDAFSARTIVVLGDCHIHSAKGIDWPSVALDAFRGTDLFVTLGDMGERDGLNALADLAPVIGVRGRDDEDDPRTATKLRSLAIGCLRIGCVFDPIEAGIAARTNPLVCKPAAQWLPLFGGALDAMLWASTHVPSINRIDGRLLLNPGSVTLPGENAIASFARLTLGEDTIDAEILPVRPP
jgi:putative phosphoesterase